MIIQKYKNFYLQHKKDRFLFFKGSARSGKTFFICQLLSILAAIKPVRIFCIAPDYPRISDLVQTFKDAAGISVRGSKIGMVANIGGSEILFRSFDTYEKAKGKEADYMYFYECNDHEFLTVKRLLAGLKVQAFFDYNPVAQFWRHSQPMFKDVPELVTNFRDNTFLPPELAADYEKDIEIANNPNATPLQIWWSKVFCLGEDSDISGQCFAHAKIISLQEYEEVKFQEFYASDFGGLESTADPDVLIGMKIDKEHKKIWARELYYSNEGGNTDIANVLNSIENKIKILVYETATNGQSRAINIAKQVTDRIEIYPAIKGAGSVWGGVRELSEWEIFITGENFEIEKERYVFAFNGERIAPIDKFNHLWDAVRYGFNFAKVKKTL